MVTKPIASQIYTKMCSASPEWFRSDKGRKIVSKAIALVAAKEGEEEARALENLLTVCAAL